MATYGYPELKIELDKAGGAAQDISNYVTAINGWTKERIVEEVTGAGESTDRWSDIGFTQKSPVILTGPYDDTVDKLVSIILAWTDGSERTLQLSFDNDGSPTDVETVEVLLVRHSRNPKRGALTEFVAELRPTGAIS